MFFGMAAISFFVMPFVMIANPFDWRPSLNQAYAAVFMGATMVALVVPDSIRVWNKVGNRLNDHPRRLDASDAGLGLGPYRSCTDRECVGDSHSGLYRTTGVDA
jgi:hypothetical protein